MKKAIMIMLCIIAIIGVKVKAISITTTEDINEIEDLIQIAIAQEPNLYVKRYIVLKSNNSIEMIIFNKEDYEIVNNEIIIESGTIITKTNNVYDIEQYNDIDITINNEIYSNVPGIEKAKANYEYEQYRDRKNIVGICMICLGIGIAILLLKN